MVSRPTEPGRWERLTAPNAVRRALHVRWQRVRYRAAQRGKRILSRLHSGQPVPFVQVRLLRQVIGGHDALLPAGQSFVGDGTRVANPDLRLVLSGKELGSWSLSEAALNYLEQRIHALQPGAVLEFGSGISTVSLARYMVELHGAQDAAYVFSIDQDARFMDQTREMLRSCGLERYVRMLHAPLCRQTIEGKSTLCYDLSGQVLESFLGGTRPDLVLIDGPATDEGRFGTLPLVHACLEPGAQFLLDDALRDDELRDATIWDGLPYLRLQGYWLEDKGFLLGQVVA